VLDLASSYRLEPAAALGLSGEQVAHQPATTISQCGCAQPALAGQLWSVFSCRA
jgi:hypothetical protein